MNKIELPFERECTRKDSDYHKKCLHYDEEKWSMRLFTSSMALILF